MSWDTTRDSASLLAYWQKLIGLAQSAWWGWAKWLDKEELNSLYDFILTNQWKPLFGYSWGMNFRFLDEITKGIRWGKIYRIWAPSNTGKSQLVYTLINNLIAQDARIMFVTLENDIQSTLSYIISNHQKVSNDDIMGGKVDWDFDYLNKNKDKLCILQDTFDLNAIFSKIIEFQPNVVILDYIGLMSIKGFTEEAKYTEYAIQVQRFVKSTQVAWIDLSNLPTQLQNSDDIRGNPQFFGSTFLRNNTDVGIHIVPDKGYYDIREKVLSSNSYSQQSKDFFKRRSWLILYVSKNRLWPHSINEKYILDHSKWWEWSVMDTETWNNIQWYSL
jgi:archaellum biogenesis ATPase FlaH